MTSYDYIVIAFYFLFMLGMGWLVARFVKTSSDYFNGGGQMMWWLVGASSFMTQFSAWTFTGAASKAYSEGWPIFVIFFSNAIGFFMNSVYFAARARQMRLVTALEAVRERFSKTNEQVFTWMQIPLGTLYAGIWLNGLCVFLTAAFGFNLETTIIVTGLVVVVMTLLGGSWAAVAGDFIQALILMPVTIVAAFLAIRAVGGPGEFIDKLPAGHLDVAAIFDSPMMMLWIVAIVIKQFISTNNLFEASRYLCVKDSRHARWASILAGVMFLGGPILWFVTPMAARILYPDLHAVFPNLRNPEEGAFFAICLATMPVGMMGLLVSGMLSATMSSMDSGLNRNAGIFIKNFYHPVMKPAATDAHLILAGKFTTAAMGVLVILAGLTFSRLEDIPLFDLMLRFGTLVAVPYTIPLVLCVLYKRTPPWSGWTTVLVCMLASYLTTTFLTPQWAERTFSLAPFTTSEGSYWIITAGLMVNVAVGCAWFFASTIFWPKTPAPDRARIEGFFDRMLRPVDAEVEGTGNDRQQGQVLGLLCLCYGAFILLLALIPNPLLGRLCFVFCGATVAGVGFVLRRSVRKKS